MLSRAWGSRLGRVPVAGAFLKTFRPSQTARWHGALPKPGTPKLFVNFIEKGGKTTRITAYDGENVLEAAHRNEIPVEGACEGSLACCTCHVILENDAAYESFKPPSEREEDLLDMAPGLTERSRLCCQLYLDAQKHNGIKFVLPPTTRNFYVDGHVPKPH